MIKIYGTKNCSRCMVAKNMASENGYEYEYFDNYDETLRICRENKIKKFPVIIKENGDVISLEDFMTEIRNKK